MKEDLSTPHFHSRIVKLLKDARKKVLLTVNQTMVTTYFEIGRMIVEEQQKGNERAEYGSEVINNLSSTLTHEFGKGFSVTNLKQMRQFYLAYSNGQTLSDQTSKKGQTASDQFPTSQVFKGSGNLSWSHYLVLMRIDDEKERSFYEIETVKNGWSVRELQRQYNSALYTRLSLSREKQKLQELSEKGLVVQEPKDAIKDPYILEFIGLPERSFYSENQLEEELINKLEQFLLELGSGFTFVARQKRISFDEKHFHVDLVFYNRLLNCFVLIDLKIGELKHQDIGQMQMYVNYYDREIKQETENKTIGIILCQNKSESVVRYTLPEENNQIFASKYKTVLPTKEELKAIIKGH